ncbi:hypothetical protein V497_01678 [Pseudogymnoascus sp. VKM F-4516 (FW-969)]|nr:hypothetical protein V497_01678 [Pseudogymnoascus sp. VKM F-4516 (FW-969)]
MRKRLLQTNKNNHDDISNAILQDATDLQELLETLRKEVLRATNPIGKTSEITLQPTKGLRESIDRGVKRCVAQSKELCEFVDDVVNKLIPKAVGPTFKACLSIICLIVAKLSSSASLPNESETGAVHCAS